MRPPSSSRSSRVPALGTRRRAAEDGDRALERRPLRGDGPRVVARIRLLLVRRVLLLVDADQAEPAHRREHRRACADDDPRVAARDPLALVPPLRVGQRRVQDRDAVAEAGAEPADRLRRQARSRGRARSRRARVRAPPRTPAGRPRSSRSRSRRTGGGSRRPLVDRIHDPLDRRGLRRRERSSGCASPRSASRSAGCGTLAASLPLERGDELERPRGCRAVVVRDPEREPTSARR